MIGWGLKRDTSPSMSSSLDIILNYLTILDT